MDQIVSFEKNFRERLDEYMLVLGGLKILPASQMQKQWSIYLEFVLDPSGWQALWKMPRSLCKTYGITYPTVVLVHVNEVQFQDLTAAVQITAVQGDVNVPETHIASLTKLWPTKQQEAAIDNIIATASALDMLRFFYKHIWMPWDAQDSAHLNRVKDNVEERLRLYYDMKMGHLLQSKTSTFRSLLAEIQTEMEQLGDEIPCYKNAQSIDLQLKIIELKTQVELMYIYAAANGAKHQQQHKYWLVFNADCSIEKHIEYLESVKCLTAAGTAFNSATSFQSAVETASAGDAIILSAGKHVLKAPGVLEDGCSVQGAAASATIECTNENALLEFFGERLHLENLRISVGASRCGVIARRGSIRMRHCCIEGHAAAQHGVVALPGADVTLEHCHIAGFDVAMYGASRGSITARNCSVSGVGTALKLFDNSTVNLIQCTFSNCRENCYIHLETEAELKQHETGDVSLLRKRQIQGSISDCTFDTADGTKQPVIVANKPEDVFAVHG